MMGRGASKVNAFVIGLHNACTCDILESAEKTVWDRVSYACRYGKGIGAMDALSLPSEDLTNLLDALERRIVEEHEASESKANKG